MPYNIFISWSGSMSRRIASEFHDWLPTAVQAAQPFLSDEDIEAGARWLPEISNQLSTIKIGLLCVTRDNQKSPWLNFEAGALAKSVDDETRVIPLAFDIDKSQIEYPLGQFSARKFTEEDMLSVVRTINRALDSPLTDQRLMSAFDLAWPRLNTTIERIRSEFAQEPLIEEQRRSVDEMVEELVEASRQHQSMLTRIYSETKKPTQEIYHHYGATQRALEQLGWFYAEGQSLSVSQLLELAPKFDSTDWDIIENAPFLYWYLTRQHGYSRPSTSSQDSDLNDVPF